LQAVGRLWCQNSNKQLMNLLISNRFRAGGRRFAPDPNRRSAVRDD
jgi:hypothetical protein